MKLTIGSVLTLLFFCLPKSLESDFHSKIVGGLFATENQFPHQIAILHNGVLRCGGSIISASWILTAAHCLLARKGM